MGIYIIFGIFALLSFIVSQTLKSKFKTYSKVRLYSGMTGKDVAEKMLRDNGINDVKVTSVQGHLTDHYNPANKTVNLSRDVYSGDSVAAAAVAAHECGHAIQHAKAYSWLQMRSQLVPVVSIASQWVQWVLLAGVLLIQVFPVILLAGIILFALTTIFSFITLPVEMDASRRALLWLNSAGITTSQNHAMASDALKWAGRTYVVAALGSLAMLVYYVFVFLGRRD
jgi:uncharacterized protein